MRSTYLSSCYFTASLGETNCTGVLLGTRKRGRGPQIGGPDRTNACRGTVKPHVSAVVSNLLSLMRSREPHGHIGGRVSQDCPGDEAK